MPLLFRILFYEVFKMLKLVNEYQCEYKEIKKTVIKNSIPFFFANLLNDRFGFFKNYCAKIKYFNSLHVQYKILEADEKETVAARIREIMAHKMSLNEYTFNQAKLYYTFDIEGQEYIMTIAEMQQHNMFKIAEQKTQKMRMLGRNNVIAFPVNIQKSA